MLEAAIVLSGFEQAVDAPSTYNADRARINHAQVTGVIPSIESGRLPY